MVASTVSSTTGQQIWWRAVAANMPLVSGGRRCGQVLSSRLTLLIVSAVASAATVGSPATQ
jgi:hypothetical protein